MVRVAFLIPWLSFFIFVQFVLPGRSRGAEVFRVIPRMGAPGVLWTQSGSVWYAKRNPFSPIREAGGNHFVTVSGEWVTVSDSGTLHLQPVRFPGAVSAGGNFLMDPVTGRIHAIDAWGYPVDSRVDAGAWKALGWNWVVTQEGVLITLRRSGVAPGDGSGMVVRKTGWDFSDVHLAGGTFLVRANGRVVTVSEITGFFREWDPIESGIRKVGGNHLIDGESRIWTVDEDGVLHRSDRLVPEMPTLHGKGWMRFQDGAVWVIDSRGQIRNEVQLVSGGHGGVMTARFFETIDPGSVFQPRTEGGRP